MNGPIDLQKLFRGPLTSSGWEQLLRCVPAAIYLGLIHLVSSVPGPDLPSLLDDRIAHFLEYFGLGVLLHFAASGFDRKGRRWLVVSAVVSFAAAWGVLDEVHQSFVPGRDPSAKDVVFDVAGATTATLVASWLGWRKLVR